MVELEFDGVWLVGELQFVLLVQWLTFHAFFTKFVECRGNLIKMALESVAFDQVKQFMALSALNQSVSEPLFEAQSRISEVNPDV